MKLVKHLLDSKGREIISIAEEASVLDAIKLMADRSIGSLLVMEGAELKGIVTERDYARKVIIKGRSSKSTRVAEIMTRDVCTAKSEQTVNECMKVMTNRRIRHLPVVENDEVLGMISIGDLVQAIIADQKEEIQQLGQYISGQV
ncbi:MAG: CBS domain-containing protein [Gammaproteobacteria bacterium]|nr:CBS domain-containing protein [Gammaproteobacteria bacterium]MBU2675698.1 CBS domain-containing protein [Gammaproteobacteria bacterium]NNC56867.1 CBS domain-containing protein [Woeseiaceae bacterium]NNL49436.1 CBS domain-containing protein [Woeseiaceae bacterium]